MKSKILIIAGDPNSINSEILYKSWKKISSKIKKKIYIISSFNLLKDQFRILKYPIRLANVKSLNENIKDNQLKVINVNLKYNNPFNVQKSKASKYILSCLNLGHRLALKKDVSGIINCPINKKLLNQEKIGVTEYLAKKCKIKNNSEVMLIKNRNLSVCPITTHINVKEISKKIKKKIIINKIKTINKWFKKTYNFNPKIGVTGLNPHNAELRKNSEEQKEIMPSISKLKKLKIKVKGPLVVDTLFISDYKKFDVIVGMYHDQVLGPFKTMFNFDAINITLGLRYLRISPDHGTANDLIKKNKAKPTSLIECIKFINKFNK